MILYLKALLCLIASVFAMPPLAITAQQSDACTAADQLFQAQLYEQARTQYVQILGQDPKQACAGMGLSNIANIQARAIAMYNLGQNYEAARQFDLARDRYIEALKSDPGYIPARTALSNLLNPSTPVTGTPTTDQKFDSVRSLLSMEQHAAAEEQLKKIVTENPGIPVPLEIQQQFSGNVTMWQTVKQDMGPVLRTIGEFTAIAILVFLGGVFVIRKFIPWALSLVKQRQLVVADFECYSNKLAGAKGLSALVEDVLSKTDDGEAVVSANLVDGSTDPLQMPAELSTIMPGLYTKLIPSLVAWLLPPRIIRLTGILHEAEDASHGVGLTLSLIGHKSGKIIDTTTIWQGDYNIERSTRPSKGQSDGESGISVAYSHLAELAAIWAQFRLNKRWPPKYLKNWTRVTQRGGASGVIPMRKGAVFTRMGTDNWESYALFKSGVRWSRLGDQAKARQLYYKALEKDFKNRGAQFNLGALDTASHDYENAKEHLNYARDASASEVGFLMKDDRVLILGMVWYNATYQLAATHTYCGENEEAQRLADELLSTMDLSIAYLARQNEPLTRFQPVNTVIRWLCSPLRGTNLAAKRSVKRRLKYYMKMLDAERLRKSLESFRGACLLINAGILISRQKLGKAQTVYEQAKATYQQGGQLLDQSFEPSTLYNLAGYYSQLAQEKANDITLYGKALERLRDTFEIQPGITRWAMEDPTLEGVRSDERTRPKFMDLVAEYEGRAMTDLPLSAYSCIGRYHALLLNEYQGITNEVQLLKTGCDQQALAGITSSLGITSETMSRWLRMADLKVALDIDPRIVNLLEAAGYGSLPLLAACTADEIRANLEHLKERDKYMKRDPLPSLALIESWIGIARDVGKVASLATSGNTGRRNQPEDPAST